MEIFKQSHDSDLFLVNGLTEEQLVAENDINRNYRSYLESIVKLSNKELAKIAPGDPNQTRKTLQLHIDTCKNYEAAFAKLIALSKDELN
jgi:hypothetical protein